MFEHAVLVVSMIPEKQVREEKLPRFVFDEDAFTPMRKAPGARARFSHLLRGRQQARDTR